MPRWPAAYGVGGASNTRNNDGGAIGQSHGAPTRAVADAENAFAPRAPLPGTATPTIPSSIATAQRRMRRILETLILPPPELS
jgi:hypothetical protein